VSVTDKWVWSVDGMIETWEKKVLKEQPVPVPLYTAQIPPGWAPRSNPAPPHQSEKLPTNCLSHVTRRSCLSRNIVLTNTQQKGVGFTHFQYLPNAAKYNKNKFITNVNDKTLISHHSVSVSLFIPNS